MLVKSWLLSWHLGQGKKGWCRKGGGGSWKCCQVLECVFLHRLWWWDQMFQEHFKAVDVYLMFFFFTAEIGLMFAFQWFNKCWNMSSPPAHITMGSLATKYCGLTHIRAVNLSCAPVLRAVNCCVWLSVLWLQLINLCTVAFSALFSSPSLCCLLTSSESQSNPVLFSVASPYSVSLSLSLSLMLLMEDYVAAHAIMISIRCVCVCVSH